MKQEPPRHVHGRESEQTAAQAALDYLNRCLVRLQERYAEDEAAQLKEVSSSDEELQFLSFQTVPLFKRFPLPDRVEDWQIEAYPRIRTAVAKASLLGLGSELAEHECDIEAAAITLLMDRAASPQEIAAIVESVLYLFFGANVRGWTKTYISQLGEAIWAAREAAL